MKECRKCHRRLSIEMFDRNVCRKDGHHDVCRECRHRQYMAKSAQRTKMLSHYPDDEIVDELVRRGTIYGVLNNIDRKYIEHYLELQQPARTGFASQDEPVKPFTTPPYL